MFDHWISGQDPKRLLLGGFSQVRMEKRPRKFALMMFSKFKLDMAMWIMAGIYILESTCMYTDTVAMAYQVSLYTKAAQGVALVIEAALSFESKTSPLILLRGAALSSGHTATEEELHSTKARSMDLLLLAYNKCFCTCSLLFDIMCSIWHILIMYI